MEALENLTCREFCSRLASSDPTPGGGGASALAGALGAALGGMVASLTMGKKKYADVQEDMERLSAETKALSTRLLELAQEDARAFTPLAQAYRMPKNTPEEQARKAEVMEKALYEASLPPLEMMRAASRALDLLAELAEKGSALALSDVGVGAALCRGALQGAILNLQINASSLADREKAEELNREAGCLLREGIEKADRIYARVAEKIGG